MTNKCEYPECKKVRDLEKAKETLEMLVKHLKAENARLQETIDNGWEP